MSFEACTVSAPGSLMLMGEHAVLHGFGALSLAVDKRIKVSLLPSLGTDLYIQSALGEYHGSLDALVVQKPFQFILTAVLMYREYLKTGFELRVGSEFSDQVGLGSSAAVTLATIAALAKTFHFKVDLLEAAKHIVRTVQGGIGSGADVAASLLGGVVDYRASVQKMNILPPIVVVYTGAKKPTTEVVALIEQQRKHYPKMYQAIFKTIDCCVAEARLFLHAENWAGLGEVMNFAQGLMDTMGLSNMAIQGVLDVLRGQPGIYGAKISGSGLGDCVIALGSLKTHDAIKPLHCAPSLIGLCYE